MTADRRPKTGAPSLVRLHFQTPSTLRDELAGAPYLTLALGNSRQTYPLPWTGEVLIGRAETCHVFVSHKAVSRVNTRITIIRGEASVTDLKSRNGTRVNGAVISETALVSGDVITVCDVELTFHEAGRSDDEPLYDEETSEHATIQNNGALTSTEHRPELRQRFPALQDEIAELTARRIAQALDATGGNQTQAARLIGMPLRTFISKLKELKPASQRGRDDSG